MTGLSRSRRWFLLASLAAALPACAAAQTADTVTVAVNGLISDAPFFIGAKKGFFARHGLNVKLEMIDAGSQMMAPLAAGHIDVAGGAVSVGTFNAVARGMNIKIVADRATTHPKSSYISLLIRKDLVNSGRVKTFADLKGLRIAQNGRGGTQASTVNDALKKGGLTYDDAVHVYNMPNPDHLNGMANKAIDGALTTEPLVTLAVKKGIAVRFTGPDLYPDQVIAALLYSGEFIKKRPDVARRFMLGYVESVRYFNDGIVDGHFVGPVGDEVIDILVEATALKDRALYKDVIVNWCNPDGYVNAASLRKDLAFFKSRPEFELVPSVTVEDAIDNSFVDYALATLGPYKPAAAPGGAK